MTFDPLVMDDLDLLTSNLEKYYHSLQHIKDKKDENKYAPNKDTLNKLF